METEARGSYRGRFSVEDRMLFSFFPYGKRSQLLYENSKPFYETFQPHSFRESLEKRPIFFFFDHDSSEELGSTSTNARIKEEMVGLKVRLDVPSTKLGDRVLNLATDGRLGLSPGFLVDDAAWENRYGVALRTIKKAELLELSFVTVPAYLDSSTCFQIPSTRHVEEPEGRETRVIVSDGLIGFPVEDKTFWRALERRWSKK